MGLTEALTLLFVYLKLTGGIDWSWWWVLSPELILYGPFLAFGLVYLLLVARTEAAIRRRRRSRRAV